jgi:uncharacterized membrane protein YjjP (DUF1212 family)
VSIDAAAIRPRIAKRDRCLAKKKEGGPMNAAFVIGRAALALLLMIGFYLLALSIAFALFWIPYAEFVYAEHITPKLAIICILGGLTILWSVLLQRLLPTRSSEPQWHCC